MASNLSTTMLPPPPPPPPPPPAMNPKDLQSDSTYNTSTVKPNMKMRTLNWSKIPKSKILTKTEVGDNSSTSNIWFIIAQSNNSIKEELPLTTKKQTGTLQTSKSSSRIRDMLVSVRRRMAAAKNQIPESPLKFDNQKEDEQAQQQQQQHLSFDKNLIDVIDFENLENLFCLNTQPIDLNESDSSNCNYFNRRHSIRTNISSDSVFSSNSYLNESCTDEETSFEYPENILDGKRSLNVNIFLKQLKQPQQNLIEQINLNKYSLIGREKLQSLLKLLPDDSEENHLLKFKNTRRQHRLPVAEKFLLKLLTEVPNLRLKIKFMLLQEEYSTDMKDISPELDKIEMAAEEIKKSKMFRDMLNLILVTGNFLNTGGYAANAIGFSLDCLAKLSDVKSNKPGLDLMHYLADTANRLNIVDFLRQEMAHVELASKVSVEIIQSDISTMMSKIRELKIEIQKEKSINCNLFLLNSIDTLDNIQAGVERLNGRVTHNLDETRKSLCNYLCEDVKTFKLHQCFHQIINFSFKLKNCLEENQRRVRAEASRAASASLRRSNTINLRLNNTHYGRQSLGSDSLRQSRQLTSAMSQLSISGNALGGEPSRQSSDNYSFCNISSGEDSFGDTNLKSRNNQFGFMSKATSTMSINKSTTTRTKKDPTIETEIDELHEGLMKLLDDSNRKRRSSDVQNRPTKIPLYGTYRRTSKLFSKTLPSRQSLTSLFGENDK